MNWKSILLALAKILTVGASSATITASSDTATQIVAAVIGLAVTIQSMAKANKPTS